MGGISLKNLRQVSLAPQNVSASVPPHDPGDTDVVIARAVAPVDGKVRALVAAQAVVPTAGNGSGFKQTLTVRNAGVGGGGTAVVTDAIVLMDLTPTPDLLPAAGTIFVAVGTGAQVRKGEILEVFHTATGTIGTANPAEFNIVDIIYEANAHLDSSI